MSYRKSLRAAVAAVLLLGLFVGLSTPGLASGWNVTVGTSLVDSSYGGRLGVVQLTQPLSTELAYSVNDSLDVVAGGEYLSLNYEDDDENTKASATVLTLGARWYLTSLNGTDVYAVGTYGAAILSRDIEEAFEIKNVRQLYGGIGLSHDLSSGLAVVAETGLSRTTADFEDYDYDNDRYVWYDGSFTELRARLGVRFHF